MYRSSNGHIQTILFILILNLALISISPGRLDSQTKEISVQIIAYRTEFKQYEEIELQLNIKNLTSHPVKIPIPNWQETIKIHLADDNGNIIMPGVIVTPGPLNPTVDLPAYQLRTEPLDLGGYRNIPPTNYGIAGAKLGPGIYNIRVTFDSVNSNEVEFRITQPPPNELKVLDEMVTLLMGPNPESNITAAQMLLKEYPQSIYRMGIYLRMWLSCRNSMNPSTHSDLLRQSVIDFIDEKPNSPQLRVAIGTFAAGVGFKIGVNPKTSKSLMQISTISDSLQNLKQRYHKYGRIERYIDEYIQNMIPGK